LLHPLCLSLALLLFFFNTVFLAFIFPLVSC
jgi:hypothetical protein